MTICELIFLQCFSIIRNIDNNQEKYATNQSATEE